MICDVKWWRYLRTLPYVHWWFHLCKTNRTLKLVPGGNNDEDDDDDNDDDDDDGDNDEEYDDGDGDSGSLKIIPGEHHDDDRIYDDWQHFQTEAKIPEIGPIQLLMLVKPICTRDNDNTWDRQGRAWQAHLPLLAISHSQ